MCLKNGGATRQITPAWTLNCPRQVLVLSARRHDLFILCTVSSIFSLVRRQPERPAQAGFLFFTIECFRIVETGVNELLTVAYNIFKPFHKAWLLDISTMVSYSNCNLSHTTFHYVAILELRFFDFSYTTFHCVVMLQLRSPK